MPPVARVGPWRKDIPDTPQRRASHPSVIWHGALFPCIFTTVSLLFHQAELSPGRFTY